jgi:hypothetical protein
MLPFHARAPGDVFLDDVKVELIGDGHSAVAGKLCSGIRHIANDAVERCDTLSRDDTGGEQRARAGSTKSGNFFRSSNMAAVG